MAELTIVCVQKTRIYVDNAPAFPAEIVSIVVNCWFYWILWTVVKPAHDEEMSKL